MPTTAVIMGGVSLAKVGYNTLPALRLPLLALLLVLIAGFLALGAVLS